MQAWVDSMGSGRERRLATPLLAVMLILIMDLGGASVVPSPAETDRQERDVRYDPVTQVSTDIEGLPPVDCGGCDLWSRAVDRGDRPASEAYGWWFGYAPDADANGVDDRLQHILAGVESWSLDSIIGPDGRRTVAVVVDFAWAPGDAEERALEAILRSHGWVGPEAGARMITYTSIDSISIDKVPISALIPIRLMEGVVVLEMQNIMVASMNVASKAVKAVSTGEYPLAAHGSGFYGDGIVIAILDTGVDNEHRSLNDMDDVDDAPNLDASTYDDRKFIAGFDATDTFGNPQRDGTDDPDDSSGHGTHVAGSALGTGGANRTHRGIAPAAGLVDVKVLTDLGNSNSDSTLQGLQWVIDNKDTGWTDANTSMRGIDIVSMSLGSQSFGSPLGDTGDNGSAASSRLVDQAVGEGLIVLCAMGNDGESADRFVPAPASADTSIAIAASDDRDTVDRDDDQIASYSNRGPRDSDGDGDDRDELKPDVTAPGTNIFAPQSEASAITLPGQDPPMADDGYTSKSGTSMATPIVAGIVALVLEAAESDGRTLDQEEVRAILHDSSEVRGQAHDPALDPDWSREWGFGHVDAQCAVARTIGDTCAGRPSSDDLNFSDPLDLRWLEVERTYRITGTTNTSFIPSIDRVELRVVRYDCKNIYGDFDLDCDAQPSTVQPWTEVEGASEWSYTLDVNASWLRSPTWYSENPDRSLTYGVQSTHHLEIRGIHGNGTILGSNWTRIDVIQRDLVIQSPAERTLVSGDVNISGFVKGVDTQTIQIRIDDGPWAEAPSTLQPLATEAVFRSQSYTATWDSTGTPDGLHRMHVRAINASGINTPAFERLIQVDNIPPTPDLEIIGEPIVTVGDLEASEALRGALVRIDATIENRGDAAATAVTVRITAPGSASSSYPSEITIDRVDPGRSEEASLWWWATEVGTHDVRVDVDPSNQTGDLTPAASTFTFTVNARPDTPMVTFGPGDVVTTPSMPLVGAPFDIAIRLMNEGAAPAEGLLAQLERWTEAGWVMEQEVEVPTMAAAETAPTTADLRFASASLLSGPVEFRMTLAGDGVLPDQARHTFTVAVTTYQAGTPADLPLNDGEVPIRFIGMEDGGLLVTSLEEELHLRVMSRNRVLTTDLLLEDAWAGEMDAVLREDGRLQMVWNRRIDDGNGYAAIDLVTTSADAMGRIYDLQSHMTPIRASEGAYWGLDIDARSGTVVIAGYHRDLVAGGSWTDLTSAFLLTSDQPDVDGTWIHVREVIRGIDVLPEEGSSIAVAVGKENRVHLLYQDLRSDVTGQERIGMFYSFGDRLESGWSFSATSGDHASEPQLRFDGGTDRLIGAWMEGDGINRTIHSAVVDRNWSGSQEEHLAPGSESFALIERGGATLIVYDLVGSRGSVTMVGMMTNEQGEDSRALGNVVAQGRLLLTAANERDLNLIVELDGVQILPIADLGQGQIPEPETSLLDRLLAPIPGDRGTQVIVLSSVGIGFLLVFMVIVIGSRRARGPSTPERRIDDRFGEEEDRGTSDELTIELVGDAALNGPDMDAEVPQSPQEVVEDQDPDPNAPTLHEELEANVTTGMANPRLERRMARMRARDLKDMIESGPPPPSRMVDHGPEFAPEGVVPASLSPDPAPRMTAFDRKAACPSCHASFTVADLARSSVRCPICKTTVNL